MNGKGKILITGGLGNLGSWLTEYFSEKFDVYVLSREGKVKLNCNYTLIKADITEAEDLELKLETEFEYCIHAASYNEFFNDNYARKSLNINSFGTRNLIEILRKTNIKNFVYISTFHIYGRESGLISENLDPRPKNDYSLTHLFAEYYVKMFHDVYNFPFTILRLTNSYGAPKYRHSTKWYLVLNDLAKCAYEKQKIVLKGSGKSVRDLVWMGDVCRVIEQCLDFNPNPENVYNLSSGMVYSMMDLAQAVQRVYMRRYGENINITLNNNDSADYLDLIVDNSRIKSKLYVDFHNKIDQEINLIFKLLESA